MMKTTLPPDLKGQAKEIADHAIAGSAEDVARTEFSADDPPQRKYNAQKAQQRIIDASQTSVEPLTLAIDVGPVRYKQVLKKLIAAEQAS